MAMKMAALVATSKVKSAHNGEILLISVSFRDIFNQRVIPWEVQVI